MIIKLVEQPIIAINEAEIAGTVDGVVIKNNKVSCIYHRNMENQFAIPVEHTIIGNDAVMIQDVTAMAMASPDVKPLKSMLEVYNLEGKQLGFLCMIEVDDNLVIQYICTENYKIEVSKIVSYKSVIVVDMNEYELAENPIEEECLKEEPEKTETAVTETAVSEALENEMEETEDEAAVSMEIEPAIKWNDENHREEKSTEGSELSMVKPLYQVTNKEAVAGVDTKYAYLCGKQLLEGIDIEDTFYEKGTIIGAELIKHAIASNAIVKVIVNAEE